MASWNLNIKNFIFDAPTPPPTPTYNVTQISKHRNRTKESKHTTNPFTIQTIQSPITALDILTANKLSPAPITPDNGYNDYYSANIGQTKKKSPPHLWPSKPPSITLYEPDSEAINYDKYKKQKQEPNKNKNKNKNKHKNKNTLETPDGGEDDEYSYSQCPSQRDGVTDISESSLCCTLYPEESETIQAGVHYTKTKGSVYNIQKQTKKRGKSLKIDETLYEETLYEEHEGSPSPSHSKPCQTATLFTSRFPKIEYLSIINDDDNAEISIVLPPIPAKLHSPLVPDSPSVDDEHVTPITPADTVISAISSFPETIQFERIPPPKRQIFNKYNPFIKRNSFKKRNSVLQGTTSWDH